MKTKIGNIVDFLEKYPEFKNKISVLGRFGFNKIQDAAVTKQNSTWLTIKTNNKKIECSTQHKLLCHTSVQFVFANTLIIGDFLHTQDGPEMIVSISESAEREDLVDIQVDKVSEFYANGIVSHNSSLSNLITFALFDKVINELFSSGKNSDSKNSLPMDLFLVFNCKSCCNNS